MINLIDSVSSSIANDLRMMRIEKDQFWGRSPFFDLVALGSRQRGTVYEKIVSKLCTDVYKLPVENSIGTYSDRMIGGYKVEIKGSGPWNKIPFHWKWQQIRKQPYERIIFLGINPDFVGMWWGNKYDLNNYVFPTECKSGQHGGSDTDNEFWVDSMSTKKESIVNPNVKTTTDYTGNIKYYMLPNWFRSMETW
jgi:hypothetical protein